MSCPSDYRHDIGSSRDPYLCQQQKQEDLRAKNLQLTHILTENQELELRLEASREAGVDALRDASQRLFHLHLQQTKEQLERHSAEKQTLQSQIMEQEEKLNSSLENLENLKKSLQDKQDEVLELEKFLERMEKEKITLTTRRNLIEHKVRTKLSAIPSQRSEGESLRSKKLEIHSLGEKIHHLDGMILAQSKKLRFCLQQIKQLNKELLARDSAVENLTERLHAAQALNKELKYKLEFFSSQAFKKTFLNGSGSSPTMGYRHLPLDKHVSPNRHSEQLGDGIFRDRSSAAAWKILDRKESPRQNTHKTKVIYTT